MAAEQIVSGDGVVHAEAGEVVQTIVTGSGQSNLSDELYLGKYIVRENLLWMALLIGPNIRRVEI